MGTPSKPKVLIILGRFLLKD